MKTLWNSYKKFLTISSPHFKISLLLLMLTYLLSIFRISLFRSNTTDTVPQLKAINTEVLKTLGPFTTRVNAGMFIKNFPVFDVNKNTFLVDAVLWFEFNGDEVMLETLEKFSVDNGKIISRSTSDIKITDGKVFAKYNVLFELKTDLNFHKFPFEDHRLPIVISNDFQSIEEMVFVVDASAFQIFPNIAPAGWKFHDTHVDAGFMPLQLDKQDASKKVENPKALFVLNFIKASSRKALIIFVPLFAATFFSLLSFVMNVTDVFGISTLVVTAVTALLGYRFVIEQMMPNVGYFTTTDLIYLFLLLFAFIIFAIQLLLTRWRIAISSHSTTEHKDIVIRRLDKISSITFILMSILLVVVTTYILLT